MLYSNYTSSYKEIRQRMLVIDKMQTVLNDCVRQCRYNNTQMENTMVTRFGRGCIRALRVLALLLCAALAGCGTQAAPQPAPATRPALLGKTGPVVGYICKELTQPWFANVSKAMETSCLQLGASQVVIMDCEMSPINYLVALDDMVSLGVDCLAVCPPDENLSQVTAERCAQEGILLLADSDPLVDGEGRLLAPAIALDGYATGLEIGRFLGSYLYESGIAIADTGFLCLTMKAASDYIPRHEGAVDGFTGRVPDFPRSSIFYADYDGTGQAAFNAASAVIVANPGVRYWVAMAPTDEGAQGICRVLEQSGRENSAAVVGIGGYAAREEFEKGTACFKASAYINGGQTGHLIAIALMDWFTSGIEPWQEFIAEGEVYGKRLINSALITPETYEDVMAA